ncbi:hypothetical protein F5X68DRAFT_207592 [Plectosphaerella plurivora]|uniref:Transcription factor domain-containing protein n=1 Tax=Plectosphaerella plurivora TaxID=936078 RepID=A0A9P8VB47_9PEZI|nr:hypothetical protein F5X68DRAFT_207592 [Plectosphaerella plurivora]
MLAGLMLQIGTQMGLHRAQYAQDFAKAPLNLGSEDITCWRRIWEWCTVVAQSVSIGCGFPLPLQQPDAERTTPTSHGGSNSESTRDFRRRLELFRDRVSSSLTPNVRSSGEQAASPERLILYRLLGADLLELSQPGASRMELDAWHLAAARVHLHAFYLFDHASTPGYQDFICTTYLSARALISSTLALDARQPRGFLEHCPFSCYQVFVCASVIVLKILFNGFFRTLLDDVDEGTKLIEGAIAALRKMSVMNNDLPARLGGVIGFFCALPDMTAIGGTTMHDLQLKHVTNRLSMSVVYDCLWTWRRHFIAMDRGDRRQDDVASFETNGQAGASDDFGDVQGMLGFDFALESWDFLA